MMLPLLRAVRVLGKTTLRPSQLASRYLSFQTLDTPNPDALKFVSKEAPIVPLQGKTFEFTTTYQAMHSPLALKLFKIPGVKSVMLGSDFLTVNKQDYVNWANLKPEVIELMDQFLTSKDEPVITKELVDQTEKELAEQDQDDLEIVSMIKELIETKIRPAIQDDGGDIEFKGFDEETGKVFLKLAGACKSCSSSEDTLKHGIESMLMHYIEEVTEVVQILDPEEEIAMREVDRLEQHLKSQNQDNSSSLPPSL